MGAAGYPGFPMPEGELTGRSVAPMGAPPSVELWPQTLGDYLKDCVGKNVTVKYSLPAGRFQLVRGRLETVGTNFLAVRARSLLLIELGSLIAVEVA